VLLVEDDQIDRMAIERHVIRQGLPFEVETAQTGAEAVQKLRDGDFDLVLLDYMLGDMTGLELLPELRGVPAIFITGMGNEEIAVSALHQGAYDYLVKDPERAYLQVLPIVIRNVLERRGAEESLRESQRKMGTLMRNLPGMAYRGIPNLELALEFVSAGCLELTGYHEEELTAQNHGLRWLIHAEDRPLHEQALARAIGGGGAYELTYRIQPRVGTPKWVWERGVVVPGSGETEAVLEGFLTDITERKTAEEQLRQAKEVAEEATRMKDRFVSLVAHDLRVPLTTCSLTFQLLRDELSATLAPRHEELFQALTNSSESMLHMIDDLLLVGRLQSGALRPKPRFLGAASLRAALVGLEQLARQKQIALTIDLPGDFRVYADPDLLGEVLQNLVTNAVKFTNPGGSVQVLSPPDGNTTLAVRDSGIGIEDRQLAGLLSPEIQRSTPGTAGERGTGLGLRICRDILAAHGGTLLLESRPGQGTTAHIRLPQVRPRVLVVGLAADDRILVERALSAFGAEIETMLPAAEFVAAVRARHPHLLVANSGPAGENLGFISALKADAITASVPILLLTAVPVRETGAQAPEEVLPLPLDAHALRDRLRRFLG
jgi:PAS domain S-box-containing protein